MNSNLSNEAVLTPIKNQIIAIDGGDITSEFFKETNYIKNNLIERDQLIMTLFSIGKTITAGCTLTASYYTRNSILLGTEAKTLSAIVQAAHQTVEFTSEYIELADYFTLEVVLKEAVTDPYTATLEVIIKKKIVESYSILDKREIAAGEEIAAGKIAYLKASDGLLWIASNAAEATASEPLFRTITAYSAADVSAGTLKTVAKRVEIITTGLTVGKIWLSTAGGVTTTEPTSNVSRVVGYNESTTKQIFDPEIGYLTF